MRHNLAPEVARAASRARWPLALVLCLSSTAVLYPAPGKDIPSPVTSHAEGHARSSMPAGIRQYARTQFDSGRTAAALAAALGMLPLISGFILYYLRGPQIDGARVSQTLGAMAALSVFWVFYGYGLSFGPNLGSSRQQGVFETDHPEDAGWPIIGEPSLDFRHLETKLAGSEIEFPVRTRSDELPELHLVLFQMLAFLAAGASLFTAVHSRAGFEKALAFSLLWGLLVYAPLAHWSAGFGWFRKLHVLDFAGATMIYLGVGASALGLWRVLPPAPAEYGPVQAAGAFMIWVGSLALHAGFGIGTHAVERAESALLAAHLSAMGGVIGWIGCAWLSGQRSRPESFTCGCLAGLAAISAGSGLVAIESAAVIGFIAGIACCQLDRTLRGQAVAGDALADMMLVQGLGGAVGLMAVGVFAAPSVGGEDSLGHPIAGLLAGNPAQLGSQVVAVVATILWGALVSTGIALVLRIRPDAGATTNANAAVPLAHKLGPV